MPAKRMFIEKFGKEVLIETDHPLALVQPAIEAEKAAKAAASKNARAEADRAAKAEAEKAKAEADAKAAADAGKK